jgi:hypothetical protein
LLLLLVLASDCACDCACSKRTHCKWQVSVEVHVEYVAVVAGVGLNVIKPWKQQSNTLLTTQGLGMPSALAFATGSSDTASQLHE